MPEIVNYVPKNWNTGDLIREMDMDHIEQGIKSNADAINDINDTTSQMNINLAPQEEDSTAANDYAVDDLFLDANGNLCKAIIEISEGDTLTENTNYVVTTLADELESIARDPQLEAKIASIFTDIAVKEENATSAHSYTYKQLFLRPANGGGYQLYKATTSISVGTTFSSSNCEQITIAEAIRTMSDSGVISALEATVDRLVADIGYVEEGTTSNNNYSIGSIFLRKTDGVPTLYKAKTAIAYGDQFSSSNCIPASITEVLNANTKQVSQILTDTSPLEDNTTAAASYDTGDLLLHKGTSGYSLYKVTQDINTGDTFVYSGSSQNCESTTIAQELKETNERITELKTQTVPIFTNYIQHSDGSGVIYIDDGSNQGQGYFNTLYDCCAALSGHFIPVSITIYLHKDIYNTDPFLTGITGHSLTFNCYHEDNSDLYHNITGAFRIYNCLNRITINKLNITYSNQIDRAPITNLITIAESPHVRITNCCFDGFDSAHSGSANNPNYITY